MPLPTPFYPCTAPLCESHEWRHWSGYLAATLYEPSHEREYYAIRNSAALIDISPLYKYEVTGPDAERLVDRVMTRDITKCKVGQVMYSPWCDDAGKVIDDGTITRLSTNHFRLTAADPNLRWFQDVGYGLEANVVDVSQALAALALQGPSSRALLETITSGVDLRQLRYFRWVEGQIDGIPVIITRTGYTGDLGYELWLRPSHAERIWHIFMDKGRAYGLLPAGLVALDISRIEAGLLLIEVDYISANHALIESQKSSPYEIGLGWAVSLNGDAFIGKQALLAEKAAGSAWAFVGLQIDWEALEAAYNDVDLPPQVAGRASRTAVPLYQYGSQGRVQIGQVTSHTFSPILKQYIALGTVQAWHNKIGAHVEMEITVAYQRTTIPATIVPTPFYNPPHKRS